MQLSPVLIIFIVMDMEVVMMMGTVIVIVTGVVNLTVQVTYKAHLLICTPGPCIMRFLGLGKICIK
jgi:FtsH-binding integral membrane protein